MGNTAIDTSASIDAFFLDAVGSALRDQRVEASAAAQTYLAGVLADFVRPEASAALNETLERPLTLVLDDALHTAPAERFERLKGLGDGTLYVCGFFGDHFEARGVDESFVASIGGYAYRTAGAMLRGGQATLVDVFDELATRFRAFVEVLTTVAERTSFAARSHSGTLRLYEKWLRTGSDRLARELAAQGLAPTQRLGLA